MTRFLLVCLGGAIGSGARYLTSLWAAASLGVAFPYGTLIVNLGGSLLLGALMHIATATELLSPEMRLLLTTGVMGGFTTYSTFNYETTNYFREGAWAIGAWHCKAVVLATGAFNIAVTVAGCLIAGWIGIVIAKAMVGR